MTFARRLLEKAFTAVLPGSSFGAAYNGFVQVATCGEEDDVREGMVRLVSFVDQL